ARRPNCGWQRATGGFQRRFGNGTTGRKPGIKTGNKPGNKSGNKPMDKFVVKGGVPLRGKIETGGAKNSALPALAATLLTDQPVVLRRIPHVRDVRTMQRLLVDIGATAEVDNGCVRIQVSRVRSPEAPYELVKTMRASSLVLGPLVARAGRARVSLPGGCAIGARPINLHLAGLEKLGARIHQTQGYIEAEAPEGLRGGSVRFDRITV